MINKKISKFVALAMVATFSFTSLNIQKTHAVVTGTLISAGVAKAIIAGVGVAAVGGILYGNKDKVSGMERERQYNQAINEKIKNNQMKASSHVSVTKDGKAVQFKNAEDALAVKSGQDYSSAFKFSSDSFKQVLVPETITVTRNATLQTMANAAEKPKPLSELSVSNNGTSTVLSSTLKADMEKLQTAGKTGDIKTFGETLKRTNPEAYTMIQSSGMDMADAIDPMTGLVKKDIAMLSNPVESVKSETYTEAKKQEFIALYQNDLKNLGKSPTDIAQQGLINSEFALGTITLDKKPLVRPNVQKYTFKENISLNKDDALNKFTGSLNIDNSSEVVQEAYKRFMEMQGK